VSAEHHDDGALASRSIGDGLNDQQEITRDEYVGQRFEECSKAAILAGRGSELAGGDFIWSPFDRNCPDLGEICFLGLAA